MNLLAPSVLPVPTVLMEVNRRGTLDFGGGAAGDRRLAADPEIRTQGRTRGGLHVAGVLPRELVDRPDHLGGHVERGRHDRGDQVLIGCAAGRPGTAGR